MPRICQQPPEARSMQKKDSSLEPSGGAPPWPYMADFCPQRLHFCCLKPPGLQGFIPAALGNQQNPSSAHLPCRGVEKVLSCSSVGKMSFFSEASATFSQVSYAHVSISPSIQPHLEQIGCLSHLNHKEKWQRRDSCSSPTQKQIKHPKPIAFNLFPLLGKKENKS